MKKRVIFLLAGLFISASALVAQNISGEVIGAFKEGNSQKLNKYLGEKVDLAISDESTCADKRRAEIALATFFSNHKVSGFDVSHQGKRGESGFVIGILMTANGTFRVNCFFRKVQNTYVIHQIRIDKTNE